MDGMRVLLGPIVTIPTIFSVLTGLFTVVLICIFTRFSTGSRFEQQSTTGGPQVISILPYWIPWIGHNLSYAVGGQDFLSQCGQKSKKGAFAIVLRGQKYTVITVPSLVEQLADMDGLALSAEIRHSKLRRFFGDRSSGSDLKNTLSCYISDRMILMGSEGPARTQKHVDKISGALERTAYNLISFNESWIDQSPWERSSKTTIHAESPTVAEVSFFTLVESYLGELSTTALLGRNFLENNPDFLEDLQLWSSKGTSFMNQTPLFLPQMSAAAAARQRVLRSLRRFRGTLATDIAGDDPGSEWSDLSDVSPLISERLVQWNIARKSSPTNSDVAIDAALVWAFNKPNTLIAWLLYRVYSDSVLLAEVRKDIKPFIEIDHMKSGLPISEPPRVKIDAGGLTEKAKLLREVMDETIRLHVHTTTYGVASKYLTLTESDVDATRLGKSRPESYILRKGELLCVPNGISRSLTRGPGTFNPAGFNSLANLKVPSVTAAGASHAFGVGRVICPGRELAEREILLTAAVVLAMWDVDCEWEWPGQRTGLCSTVPHKDIRVRISRMEGGDDVG